MNNSDILLLEKIFHLSQRLESNIRNEIMEPWDFNCFDIIQIQEAGKKISNFIGMPNLTFVITYKKQNEKIAGHIELNNNNDEGVFIEIDEKYKFEKAIVLAILAHEICHKLIHISGLTLAGHENEILTDVATVYSGLGKLSLNGCEVINTYTNSEWDGNKKITTTTTSTQKVGYLDLNQFAFVYKVICKMRRIPVEYTFNNLNKNAKDSLNNIHLNLSDDFFFNDIALSTVSDFKKNRLNNLQVISALNIKLFTTINYLLKSLNKTNNDLHKKIKSIYDEYYELAKNHNSAEGLNYIKNLLLTIRIKKEYEKFEKEESILSSLNITYSNVVNGLIGNKHNLVSLQNNHHLYLIECPICSNKMRLQQNKLVKIKCSNCKYSFLIDNTLIDIRKSKSIKQKLKRIISIIKE